MARGPGLYSRIIAGLTVILPVLALALLSTLFLFSSSRDALENVPFADALEQGGKVPEGVSGPRYSGTTEDGSTLTVTADRARPRMGGDVEADGLVARLQMQDGSVIDLTSAQGLLREGERLIELQGGVTIRNDLGYVLVTDALVSELDRSAAHSLAPVTGDGPLGHLEAGRMEIVPNDADGTIRMHFTGGVKLIYQPPEEETDP